MEADLDAAGRLTAAVAGTVPRWQRKEALKAVTSAGSMSAVETTGGSVPGTPRTPRRIGTPSADRFIPNRACMDVEVSHFNLCSGERVGAGDREPVSAVAESLFYAQASSRILTLKNKPPVARDGYENSLRVLYTAVRPAAAMRRSTRHIPQAPERVLDAPALRDDFYLRLLDWSAQNTLAVALDNAVYLWNAANGSIQQLLSLSDGNYVSSVRWVKRGHYIAVGTSDATVQLWDAEGAKFMRTMTGHQARVGALSWNEHTLASGSKSGHVFMHDVRVRDHHVATLEGHTQEVCGLEWSPDGAQLASGGNDNLVNIWATGVYDKPQHTLTQYQAAVKALAWCPWQNRLLAGGGGTADRHIRIFNTTSGACVAETDTQSQVSGLLWNTEHRELVSGHGFSKNELNIWRYPSLEKVAELRHHTARVLHMALSPDGTSVISAAADERLCLWKCFEHDVSRPARPTKATLGVAQPTSMVSNMINSIR